ncbi:MAG: preprotein translocase subunit SecA [Lentisphaeria bacterium]
MLKWALKRLFGSKHERSVKRMRPLVRQINRYEEEYQKLSDDDLRAKTVEFRERLSNGETTDDLLPEAFAAVKNTCRRMVGTMVDVTGQNIEWEMIPYDVQLIGGIALHQATIAEMQTGEGKTLVAVLPLYLNALTGNNCQLITVNDYLARRDAEWVGSVLVWLGLSVGCIQNNMAPAERREQYNCDVTYGTSSEFGFDYLRDMGMASDPEQLVQRDYFYVIIDEIDSILIDEARTPLIISGPSAVSTHRYDKLKPDVEKLHKQQYQLCTQLINDAKKVILDENSDADDLEDAYMDAFKVRLGMPKHKQLMRLLEDPEHLRRIEKLELQVRSDQNRALFQEVKESLFFMIDERAGDADLSERGRNALRSNDSDAFLLPDLATDFQEIESDKSLTAEEKIERRKQRQTLFDERSEMIHNISQLLRAYSLFERDERYIVQENKVIIVDENTGRAMPGRRFNEGLHQALEAKEGVEIERETQTLATVTIQNYFRMYEKLAGMTGTADTEAMEFKEIYNLDVLVVPTNREGIRNDCNDLIFKTQREKYAAIIREIKECNQKGQPVLLGTISVEVSEKLSRMLRADQISHNVLNAKNHLHEAEIVARAGQYGAVTIATNMAGRGTDIRLGEGVKEAGGLHVIGSERHDSRRIDRQLRGRCARQGDPGSSRFYISLQDNLMRLFGSDRIAKLMDRFGMEDGEELSHPLLNRSVEGAQRKIEQRHFAQRKQVLKFDDVMNKQREVIYNRRYEILKADDTRELLFDFVDDVLYSRMEHCEAEALHLDEDSPFDSMQMLNWLNTTLPIAFVEEDLKVEGKYDREQIISRLGDKIEIAYNAKIRDQTPEDRVRNERHIMLSAHDEQWQEHLFAMDALQEGIYQWSHAQRDPVVEYKREAFEMFGGLLNQITEKICSNMFRSTMSIESFRELLATLPQQEVHRMLGQFDAGQGQVPTEGNNSPSEAPMPRPKAAPIRRQVAKVGRNEPCPCGSGKKYKKCCGRAQSGATEPVEKAS